MVDKRHSAKRRKAQHLGARQKEVALSIERDQVYEQVERPEAKQNQRSTAPQRDEVHRPLPRGNKEDEANRPVARSVRRQDLRRTWRIVALTRSAKARGFRRMARMTENSLSSPLPYSHLEAA